MNGTHYTINITEEQAGSRVDKALSDQMPDLSRSYLQKLIRDGNVSVNHLPAKANTRVAPGDTVSVFVPAPEEIRIEPEPIPLRIVYEDDDLLIINKEKGMVVHPAPGHMSGTLVNAVLYHCRGNLSGINGILRPGIVHRIDRDTTGLLVVCKNDTAHRSIADQLKTHSITRAYHALAFYNITEDSGTIDAPIGRHPTDRKRMCVDRRNGKEAVTHYRVLERFRDRVCTYIECRLETGRTHQIRVHMASIQHPLLGDTVYGPSRQPFALDGQCLHAKTIGFLHPRSGQYMEFDSELPDYFQSLLSRLRES